MRQVGLLDSEKEIENRRRNLSLDIHDEECMGRVLLDPELSFCCTSGMLLAGAYSEGLF